MLPRLALLFVLMLPARADVETFYLGTYTNGTASEGIYSATLDPATGKLGPVGLAAAVKDDPTFLALAPGGKFLFAGLGDAVASFAVRPGGKLTEISCQPCRGRNICSVVTDRTGHRLYAASYDSALVAVFDVDVATGRIGALRRTIPLTGSGPNAERQESSHPHSVNVDPANRFLYVCDLGADRVWNFRLDPHGLPTPAAPPAAVAPSGSGARHSVFSPDGKLLYVANELGVSTSVYARDGATGALRLIDTLPNVDPPWPKGTGSAEIEADPTKNWLLVSTRLRDFMTVFAINRAFDPSAADPEQLPPLRRTAVVPCPVKFPRSFAIDPSGKWIVVAGETDDRISVMKFDPATGELTPTGHGAAVPRPVAVLFAR